MEPSRAGSGGERPGGAGLVRPGGDHTEVIRDAWGNRKRKRRGCPRRYFFAIVEIDQPRVLSGYCGAGGIGIGAGCIMTGADVTNPDSTGNFQRMPSMKSFELRFENL
jgi:hypothetical protein